MTIHDASAQQSMTSATSNDPISGAYDMLKSMAAKFLADQRSDHTLQPTALVHEAWIRLCDWHPESNDEDSRAHFVASAAQAMRHILVDHARRQQSLKRGRGWNRTTLCGEILAPGNESALDTLALDEALQQLAGHNADLSKLAELRLFGGLTIEQCAVALDWPKSTTQDRWTMASAHLSRALWNAD